MFIYIIINMYTLLVFYYFYNLVKYLFYVILTYFKTLVQTINPRLVMGSDTTGTSNEHQSLSLPSRLVSYFK